MCALNYAAYCRIRDAIDKAKVTGPMGARGIIELMIAENDSEDWQAFYHKKLLKFFNGQIGTASLGHAEFRQAA
jgi:hypothetical protein